MKVVILAGGLGTRLSEETYLKPKPMVEIGNKPILWHILKIYSHFGFNEFIICCGYKGYIIKEYFANYLLHTSDITFHMDESNKIEVHQRKNESWKVTLVDTGDTSQTGGRLGRIRDYINDETFFFTYGDGLANVNIKKLLELHKRTNKEATLSAVQPPGRYGSLVIEEDLVSNFQEKPIGDNAWISGGFFVLEPSIFDKIEGDHISFENDVLPGIAQEKQLAVYKHKGFWQAMDTLRDKMKLEDLIKQGNPPWTIF